MLKLNGPLGMKVFNQPLMIEPGKADIIIAALAGRFGLQTQHAPELQAALSAQYRTDSGPVNIGGVLVLPVLGTLVQKMGGLDAMSGLQSYQELGDMLLAAAEDNSVKGILLDISSPGGEVAGVFELVETIAAINKEVKPVWAVANEHAFSAAYAIASAAGKIFLPETGGVGSIGVIAEHIDLSRQNEMQGVVVTQIYAGAHKTDMSMDKPLSDAGRERLQTMVNRTYDIFVSSVATNRGLNQKVVRNTEAQIYFGQEAVDIGLADGIDSLDNVLNNMIHSLQGASVTENVFKLKGQDMRLFNSKQKAEAPVKQGAETDSPATTPEQPAIATAPAQVEQEPESPAPAAQEPEAPASEPAQTETERAAAVAELCAANNMAARAAEFIREGLTIEQVKEKMDSANAIRQACKLAKKPDLADGFIDSGLTVAKVNEKLLNALATEDESVRVNALPSPEAVKESATKEGNLLHAAVDKRNTKATAK